MLYQPFFGRPILSTVVIWAVVSLVAYFVCCLPRRKMIFDFDPGGRHGEFEAHAKRYQALASLVLTLSTASIAFLLNFLVNLTAEARNRSLYSLKLESGSPRAIVLLCLSATCALLFLLFENLFYEDYVHSKYTPDPKKSKETYTGKRYALVLTLAWTGLLWFFFAYTFLTYKVLG